MIKNIVNESPKDIISMAAQMLKGRLFEAFVVILCTTLIADLPSLLFSMFDYGNFIGYLLQGYSIFIAAPLQMGLAFYFLRLFRNQPGGIQDIKDGFNHLPNALSLYLSIWIRTTIGFMLFVIPGILIMLKYAVSFFILADDPQKHYRQCMLESAYLMQGNKTKLVSVLLCLLPIIILCAVPQTVVDLLVNPGMIQQYQEAIAQQNLELASSIGGNSPLLVYLASLVTIFSSVVAWASQACFYDLLTGNLVVKSNGQI